MSHQEKQGSNVQLHEGRRTLSWPVGAKAPILRTAGRPGSGWPLIKERLVVGSIQSADIRLAGEGVSPIHAVIELEAIAGATTVRVYDLASDTGTFLAGKKVVTSELKEGDSLTIGRHTLVLAFEVQKSPEENELQGRALFHAQEAAVSGSVVKASQGENAGIFDYSPMVRSSTAVVVFWYGNILETFHLTGVDRFLMGPSERATVCLPELLSVGDYVLFERGEEKTALRLDPRMQGVIKQGREFASMQDLMEKLKRKNAGLGVELQRGDFAKIVLANGVQIFLHHTYAPPRLRDSSIRDRDPVFFRSLVGSLAFTAAIILGLRALPSSQLIDAEQLPDRVATLLYTAEKPRPILTTAARVPQPQVTTTPVQTPTPQKTSRIDFNQPRPLETKTPRQAQQAQSGGQRQAGQQEAREGAGARAKGQEGQRGKPNARETGTPQTVATRPSADGGKGRGSGNSQVPDQGNVDLLKGVGAQFLNVLGNSAANLGKGGEKVAGFGTFSTAGKGGQALTGAGKGGGGTAETLAGGLAQKGTGGDRLEPAAVPSARAMASSVGLRGLRFGAADQRKRLFWVRLMRMPLSGRSWRTRMSSGCAMNARSMQRIPSLRGELERLSSSALQAG